MLITINYIIIKYEVYKNEKIINYFSCGNIDVRRINHLRDQDGTGIGLAIVKHIVKRYKGKIVLKLELNNGLEISVIIPI